MRTVYVYVYRGLRSGGPEALHQLVHELTRQGVRARLVATPETRDWPVVREYDSYGCRYADVAPDDPDSVVVVPEVAVSLLGGFHRAQRVVWWLSVDFGEPFAPGPDPRQRRELNALVRSATNLVQSAYAAHEVTRRLGVPTAMLSDYVTASPPEPRSPDAGSVAYNPSRGEAYLAPVRERVPDLDWRPIQGLGRAGVDRLLGRTAAYLDLGAHPGKDRIPREAALAGCVVLVGQAGSAAYDEDVPLDDCYKVDLDRSPAEVAEDAAARLRAVLADPAPHREAQRAYVDAIGRERETFRQEVAAFVARVVRSA